jgi:hypothetical protein
MSENILFRAQYLGLVLILIPATASMANVAIIDGPVFNPENGHEYFLLDTSDWTDAESTAQAMSGNLATVRNATENSWIESTFGDYGGSNRFLWIGFYDPTEDAGGGNHASDFVWVDGEPVTYTNWSGGEPDNLNGIEYWTEVYPADVARGPGYGTVSPGTWNDVPDSSYPYEGNPSGNNFGPVYGVVEVVPEPMFTGTLGCSVLLFVRRRSDAQSCRNCHPHFK